MRAIWSLALALLAGQVGAVAIKARLVPANHTPANVASDEITKIYLRKGGEVARAGSAGARWEIDGHGPAWTRFEGEVWGLRFKAGEEFAVEYVNQLDEPSAIHGHGMIPPYTLDGVPFVDAPPIEAGRSALYVYELEEEVIGTHWLHSHYGFQHELGLAVPLVVDGPMPVDYPRAKQIDKLTDVVLFLEDFCSFAKDEPDGNQGCMDPHGVYKVLHDTWKVERPDFDFSECQPAGEGSGTWDVGYRQHLANEREAHDPVAVLVDADTSQLRLRIINAADMSNYRVDLGQLTGELIATDGHPVAPHEGAVWWTAIGQRMDVVVDVPTTPGAYAITAVSEGDVMDAHVRQSVLVLVVGGEKHLPPPGTYSAVPLEAPGMMRGEAELALRAWAPLPPPTGPVKRFEINSTGDNGFMSINNGQWQLPPEAATYHPNPSPMLIESGDHVCVLIRNYNKDSHPFHLHGHVFQVVAIGDVDFKGPMRDTVLVDAGECATTEICFLATHPGVWPFHCHMSYHLAAGMLTSFEYVEADAENGGTRASPAATLN
eukprot:CAMPEP_0182928576 /NCGR_PEP_ID=MMETSP0105_2-20130417/15657_1 /TAXON_ID=81532 ORGANISM="Acanthoeca-like sp., Strain 10tr" /NCGR_SAMPLE_ID=MMETSP0105_2 /ASSEMBLY_ACC=CAM_ASM_000205 /LENGTH=544 /DNA_ID=CAMNT_0025066581 /DNA_START=45 /DNA_END=1679 /DNA_ORIENTATION=-